MSHLLNTDSTNLQKFIALLSDVSTRDVVSGLWLVILICFLSFSSSQVIKYALGKILWYVL